MEKILDIPVYEALITDSETGMYCISLVDEPAVESNFLKFNKEKEKINFQIENEEQKLITGVIMRSNFPIYRRTREGFEYYIIFSKETIEIMAEKWLAEGITNNINLDHNADKYVNGLFLKEVFIKDTSRGINPKGFEDIEEGSLFGTYKVLNEDVWTEIKNGTFKGFSLEGYFDLKECEIVEVQDEEEETLWFEILSMLKECEKRGLK